MQMLHAQNNSESTTQTKLSALNCFKYLFGPFEIKNQPNQIKISLITVPKCFSIMNQTRANRGNILRNKLNFPFMQRQKFIMLPLFANLTLNR